MCLWRGGRLWFWIACTIATINHETAHISKHLNRVHKHTHSLTHSLSREHFGKRHTYQEHIFNCEKWNINDFITVSMIKKRVRQQQYSFNAIALEENFFMVCDANGMQWVHTCIISNSGSNSRSHAVATLLCILVITVLGIARLVFRTYCKCVSVRLTVTAPMRTMVPDDERVSSPMCLSSFFRRVCVYLYGHSYDCDYTWHEYG